MSDNPTEAWTPQAKGRALYMIHILANTKPSEWRTKQEIYEGLKEFRNDNRPSNETHHEVASQGPRRGNGEDRLDD